MLRLRNAISLKPWVPDLKGFVYSCTDRMIDSDNYPGDLSGAIFDGIHKTRGYEGVRAAAMESFRRSGIEIVGDIPWGTHICQLYRDGKDLADILAPYFKAGLEDNEYCLWITAESFAEESARGAMREILPGFDAYLEKGQMEIVSHTAWYLRNGNFESQQVLDACASRLGDALNRNYDGIRVAGDAGWLDTADWREFAAYEKKVNESIGSERMLALCCYPMEKCGASGVIDVIQNHQFALSKHGGGWEYVENAKRRRKEIDERELAEKRTHTTNALLELFARKGSRKEYLDEVVGLMSAWSGCRCVGIRGLDEEGNIPYESCKGFSGEFCELESRLSVKRDRCLCVRLTLGKPEPQDMPSMTQAGSFYTNDTLEFVGSLSDSQKASYRGVCVKMGFRSLAVIPVRYRDVTVGVIHFADQRPGKVPLSTVEFIEFMAPLIGEAIHRFKIEEDLRYNHDTQAIINMLLHLSLEGFPLDEILNRALESILSVPWLSFESRGAIFLIEHEPDVLVMKAEKGLCHSCRSVCERVPVGRCLCGRAASTREILFTDKFDEANHETLYENIGPHGHYCVPIVSAGKTLGIVNVSLKEGHHRHPKEEEFLKTVAMTLAGIVERRRTESRSVLLSAAIEQAAEDVVIFDHDRTIQYVNGAFENAAGYTRDELVGGHAGLIRPGGRDRPTVRRMWETVEQGEVWTGNLINLRRDGTEYEVEAMISPVRNPSGKIVSYVALGRDLSRQRKLEQQLFQAQKMEALGTLAGGIAHDFNNILMIIAGSIETALNVAPDETRLQTRLNRALSACQRGKDLAKQFLSFSRTSERERNPVQIGLLVKEALKLIRASFPSTIEIRFESTNIEATTVRADPTQIHQVIINLCTNAAHAMQEKGGALEVGLSNVDLDERGASRHADLKPGPYVKMSVRDTGYGMSREIQDRLFEPFFTTKTKVEGTGLGLSVVHNIVQSHNGAIMVESEPGAGALFEIFFPRTEMEERHDEKEQVTLSLAGDERILLVDDEESLVDATSELLESLGYRVVTKTASLDALDLFRKRPDRFDLVITDLTMPKMTGMELARELIEIRPSIPVILCTGFLEPAVQMRARSAGIRAFLMKPIDRAEMAATIRRVLDTNE